MLRKMDMSPFQGSDSVGCLYVGALPRPKISDAFSVTVRKSLSLKGTNTVAEGNALGNQTNEDSQTLKGFHTNGKRSDDA